MKITNSQIKKIHALLPPRVKEDKEAKTNLIAQYTGSVTATSTKDLTFSQANQLIISLGGLPIILSRAFMRFDVNKKQHRTVLSLCHQLGWKVYSRGRYIADMHRLAEWLQYKSPVQKSLIAMEKEELSKVIFAMENMVLGSGKKK